MTVCHGLCGGSKRRVIMPARTSVAPVGQQAKLEYYIKHMSDSQLQSPYYVGFPGSTDQAVQSQTKYGDQSRPRKKPAASLHLVRQCRQTCCVQTQLRDRQQHVGQPLRKWKLLLRHQMSDGKYGTDMKGVTGPGCLHEMQRLTLVWNTPLQIWCILVLVEAELIKLLNKLCGRRAEGACTCGAKPWSRVVAQRTSSSA